MHFNSAIHGRQHCLKLWVVRHKIGLCYIGFLSNVLIFFALPSDSQT